jgi:EmrB/QacA subfamily drug resistance transporter
MAGISAASEKPVNKWLTLIAVSATGFLAVMDMSITNISFPALTRAFDTDASVVLWTSAVYSLATAGLTPVFGRIADIYGQKKIFILGITIFTVGLGLCAVCQTISQLIVARAIQGVGGAMIFALTIAIITEAFPDNERGRALGITAACHLVGPLIGPTVGGLLLDTLGWRSIFYFRLPLCIIAIILAIVLLRNQKIAEASRRIDFLGAAVLVSGVSCLVLYFNLGGRLSFTEPALLALLVFSLIMLSLFILKTIRTENPIVDLSLFSNRVFSIGIIIAVIHSLTISMQALVMPFYLVDGRGFSTALAGLLMSIAALCIITISPISGWLSDKVGSKALCPIGLAIACLAACLISQWNAESTIFQILYPQAMYGLGSALLISPNTSMIMGAAPRDKLGLASALTSTVRQVSMATGTVISGAVFTTRQAFYTATMTGTGLEEPVLAQLSLINGFRDTFLVIAGVMFIGVLITIIGFRIKK